VCVDRCRMAPYPKNKLAKLVTDVEQGRAALAEGK
jgi:hypothetical protein